MSVLMMEFPDDRSCETLDQQYMFGDSLLIAPLFNNQGTIQYYLPKGLWTHFISGAVIKGRQWLSEDHNYFSLPIMVKQGSLIPVGNNLEKPDYNYSDGVVFHLFELNEGQDTKAVIHNKNAEKIMEVKISYIDNIYKIEKKGRGQNWKVLIRGINKKSNIEGASQTLIEQGLLITADAGKSFISLDFNK